MSSIAYTSPMTIQDRPVLCPANVLHVTLYLEDPSREVPRARVTLYLEDPSVSPWTDQGTSFHVTGGSFKGSTRKHPLNTVLGVTMCTEDSSRDFPVKDISLEQRCRAP